MQFQHIHRLLTQTPLMITQAGWAQTYEAFNRYLDGRFNMPEPKAYDPNRDTQGPGGARRSPQLDNNGIGHLYVEGSLAKGVGSFEKSCYGICDYNDLEKELDLLAARLPRGYVFHVNTPGGSVRGLAELAAKIDALTVPRMVHTEDLMASAGYYLFCGCDYLYATKSSEVGCIGTILQTWDLTEYYAKLGVKSEPIVNEGAIYKGMGGQPALSAEQKAHLQGVVNKLGAEFKNRITNFRAVEEDTMRGQTFFGDEAPAVALTDGVKSYEEAYTAFLTSLNK